MADLHSLSNTIVNRLMSEPDFRQRFQRDPIGCLRDCGCPEDHLPDVKAAGDLDFIELGRKIEGLRGRPGGEVGAIAVACVVI